MFSDSYSSFPFPNVFSILFAGDQLIMLALGGTFDDVEARGVVRGLQLYVSYSLKPAATTSLALFVEEWKSCSVRGVRFDLIPDLLRVSRDSK